MVTRARPWPIAGTIAWALVATADCARRALEKGLGNLPFRWWV